MRSGSTRAAATGYSRNTMRCTIGTFHAGASAPWLRYALTGASPHTMTAKLRNTHGIHDRPTLCVASACVAEATPPTVVGSGCAAKADVATVASSQRSDGCQARQNAASAAIDARPPAMSTSSGPMKLLQANCTAANVPPQTSTAGHTERSPRQPLIETTSHAGTISETNGNCRPAIIPSVFAGIPVTAPSVRMGVPIAPNATGAVLAISERPAAYSGVNPRPMSSAEQ